MTPTDLTRLLRTGADIADIADTLDALDPFSRQRAVLGLGQRGQAALYRAAAASPPLSLLDFVPANTGRQTPVAHRGANTLPLPGFKRFTKWMARNGEGEIFGYNDGPGLPLIGPGYFLLGETPPAQADRGAVVVDYNQIPEGDVPTGWPPVRPNWVGLQIAVYGYSRDYLRRVSRQVTIGTAYKWGVPVGSYFVLCREDPAAERSVTAAGQPRIP